MAKQFDEIVDEKSLSELYQMKHNLNNYVPYKQRIILEKIEIRETQARQDAVIRVEARKVTLETLEDWFRTTFEADGSGDEMEKSNEDIISNALAKLVDSGKLKIPRGGYLITQTKAGVVVKKPGRKPQAAKPKK